MESPQLAWEFMKKLADSPWAPIIKLIQDPEALGTEPKLDLKEDLADCAVVAEEADSSVQNQASNEGSSDDSNSVPRYCPSVSDSDDSVVLIDDVDEESPARGQLRSERLSASSSDSSNRRSRTRNQPVPKSKKRVSPSSRSSQSNVNFSCRPSPPCGQLSVGKNPGEEVREGGASRKSCEYNGQLFTLKHLKVVLIDLKELHIPRSSAQPPRPFESSEEVRGEATDPIGTRRIPKDEVDSIVLSSDDESASENSKSSTSSNFKLKRPYNFCWGLDSIQELEKRRKLGKSVRKSDDDEVTLVTPCSSENPDAQLEHAKSVLTSKPSLGPAPDNIFGLNAWRLGLVMQELTRLEELAGSLQKNRMKFDVQKQVAYKFKYGLNEVARLVTRKSLNSIVAKQERLETIKQLKSRVLNDDSVSNEAVVEYRQSSKTKSPSVRPKQFCKVDGRASRSDAYEEPSGPDRPVVDVYMPTLVQGVAAGFRTIFDRLERLESQCDDIEKTVSRSKGAIDIGELD